jgi:hypothetical protein
MLIVFGTRFCGKVATVNNQWIESKFFSVMFIPIFPVGSMFVTGSEFRRRMGFNLAVNAQSVKAVYGRIFSLVFAAWFLFLACDNFGSYGSLISAIIYLVLGLLFLALCGYFYLYYGKASHQDILLRNKMGHLTGYYALPHWFDYGQLRNMLGNLELQYKQKYPDSNWKADLQSNTIEPDKHMLLFGLALFNCMVYDLPENDELYVKADQLFVLEPESVLY